MPRVSGRLLDSAGMRYDLYATPAAANETLHPVCERESVCVCVSERESARARARA
jgi:hypothetical protein